MAVLSPADIMRTTGRTRPIGPVAAFTPWSAPTSSAGRKLGGALAAGCSVVLKASEETPGGACALVQCFRGCRVASWDGESGIWKSRRDFSTSDFLPGIRLITFTGSVPVGMHLAKLAATVMKPAIMELGGHFPVIVCKDADPATAARLSVTGISAMPAKFVYRQLDSSCTNLFLTNLPKLLSR